MLGSMASRLAAQLGPRTDQTVVPRYGGLGAAAWTAISLLTMAVAAELLLRGADQARMSSSSITAIAAANTRADNTAACSMLIKRHAA